MCGKCGKNSVEGRRGVSLRPRFRRAACLLLPMPLLA